MSITVILRGARALIDEPSKWTRDHYARKADGDHTHPLAEDAVCWCLLGAVRRAAGDARAADARPGVVLDAYRVLANAIEPGEYQYVELDELILTLSIFNDTGSHAAVLAKIDEAIREAST